MDAAAPRAYHFDGLRVDLARRQLIAGDAAPLQLSSRAYDALVYLIENRDRVIDKDELLKAVWPRVIVEENNLNQAISSLRRALADQRESPRYIATIPGRGYRFVADVNVEFDAAVPAETQQPTLAASPPTAVSTPSPDNMGSDPFSLPEGTVAPATRTRRWVLAGLGVSAALGVGGILWSRRTTSPAHGPESIAVLPFQPLIESTANAALELGMADTLIARLSGLPGMVVAPFSSVRPYAGRGQDPLMAGRELNVSAVLESHIQVQDDRVRLTARLLDVDTGAALWSGRFDERLGDFFAVQDALAQQVVDALAVELSTGSRQRLSRHDTDNVEAWQLYLRGRFYWGMRNEDGFRRAIEFYDAALALDPKFALPAAGLADTWAVMGVFNMLPPANAFAQARAAALRAIALDGELAEAQAALGHVMVQADRDWKGGERQYRLALTLRPTYGQAVMWLANNYCFQGRIADALEHAQRAQSMEPLSVAFAANVGMIQYFARDFDSANERLAGLVEAVPQYAVARRFLVRVLLARGEVHKALATLEGHEADDTPGGFADYGRALALDGQHEAARREISRVEGLGAKGFGVGYDMSLICAALGERDQALAALERGLHDSSQIIGFLNSEPALDGIRDEPRFRAVSQRLGLG